MSFYKISTSLQTFLSSSRVVSRSQPTRLLQAAHFKLLRQNVFFHSTPQNYSTGIVSLKGSSSYSIANSTPQPAHLQKAYDKTIKEYRESYMMVSQLQGTFLTTLCKLMNAKKVLEIGCFTGYSALCMAEGIKGNGTDAKVLGCEYDEKYAKIALQNAKEAGMNDLIEIKVGDARETLQKLDESTRFDLIFIDADKSGYVEYYETILKRNLLADKGVIVVDNVLFQGLVEKFPNFDPEEHPYENIEPKRLYSIVKHLHAFNEHVSKDPRTRNLLIPAFDGLMVIQKN